MSPTPSQSTAMPDQTHHLIGGILGGFASTVTLYPLELLKTRMQVIESSGVLKAGSMYNATRTILSNEGVRGLYQGVTPAIVASSGSWGAYFYLYEASKLRRKNSSAASLGVSDHLLAGFEAGVILVFLFNPLWLIKTRMALQGSDSTQMVINRSIATDAIVSGVRYGGMIDAFKTIVKEEGVIGLYRGVVPAILLTSHGAIQFASYEKLKEISTRYINRQSGQNNTGTTGAAHSPPAWVSVAMGGISKIFASTVTYPYQVIKSRLQQRPDINAKSDSKAAAIHKYNGTIDCVKRIWRNEGMYGYFKGVLPNALKVAPSAAITFLIYEETLAFLKKRSI